MIILEIIDGFKLLDCYVFVYGLILDALFVFAELGLPLLGGCWSTAGVGFPVCH